MPPDSSCGYRVPAWARPRRSRSVAACARASCVPRPRTRWCASVTCRPARISGSSESHGSCGSTAIRSPQCGRNPSGRAASSRWSPSTTRPRAARSRGRVPMIACASRLLPDPVSPRTTSGSSGSRCRDTGCRIGVPPWATVMSSAFRRVMCHGSRPEVSGPAAGQRWPSPATAAPAGPRANRATVRPSSGPVRASARACPRARNPARQWP